MPPPEKLWILSQGRGFGREDRCEHGGGLRIKHFGQGASTFILNQTLRARSQPSSLQLSEHFANMCSIPSKVGTEMKSQKAEPGKEYHK